MVQYMFDLPQEFPTQKHDYVSARLHVSVDTGNKQSTEEGSWCM